MKAPVKHKVHFRRRFQNARRAFTLIELLVVIALTTILMTIIFKPLINSIALSAKASTQSESQATARDLVAQIEQTLTGAAYVIDNAQDSQNAQNVLNLWFTDSAGNEYSIPSQFTMLEYIPPAHQLDQSNFSQLPIDPTSGAPTYNFPGVTTGMSGLAFPLVPGSVVGRIFIGLKNNATMPAPAPLDGMPTAKNPYFNYYEYEATDSDARPSPNSFPTGKVPQDNRYMLYRAEVPTFVLNKAMLPAVQYIPNLFLFHTGPDMNGNTDMTGGPLILHDPNFFYDNSLAGGHMPNAGDPKVWALPGWQDLNGDGKVEISENWHAVASALARTDKVDMIALQRDPVTNGIIYNADDPTTGQPYPGASRPVVSPLATFKPAFVQNDPGVPTNVNDSGNEVPNPISPNFSAQYDHWAYNYRVFIYRDTGSGKDPTQNNPLDYYEAITDPVSGNPKIVHVTPAMNISPGMAPPDPTTLPDVGPQLANGIFNNPNVQFGCSVNTDKGLISFSYPSTAVIRDAQGNPLGQRFSPDAINNAQFTLNGSLTGPRWLSLLSVPTTMWQGNQLNPTGLVSPLLPAGQGGNLVTPSLTPGSELVFGPDQRPGMHYGWRTQYTRVPANSGVIGPNQYTINYVNNPNPLPGSTWQTVPSLYAGYIQFDSAPDGASYNSGTLQNGGTGIDSSTGLPAAGPNMLPIFKLDPANGLLDLPSDPVEIYYNFQMNQPGDVVKIDYLTRDLMIFSLEMRLYDTNSAEPQITRLTDKIRVRNLQH